MFKKLILALFILFMTLSCGKKKSPNINVPSNKIKKRIVYSGPINKDIINKRTRKGIIAKRKYFIPLFMKDYVKIQTDINQVFHELDREEIDRFF